MDFEEVEIKKLVLLLCSNKSLRLGGFIHT